MRFGAVGSRYTSPVPMRSACLALLLTVSLPALAQDALTEKGTLTVGGTAGVSRYSTDLTSGTTVFASPRLGLFVVDGLAVGASVGVSRTTSRQTLTLADEVFELETEATSISATPFATYYIGDPAAPVLPFVSASAGINYFTSEDRSQSGSPRVSREQFVGEAAAGALVRLGANVGLTGEGYYTWRTNGGFDLYGVRGGLAVFLGR